MITQKTKMIFSRRFVVKLIELGFMPSMTVQNPYNKNRECWIFNWTEEFAQAFEEVAKGLSACGTIS